MSKRTKKTGKKTTRAGAKLFATVRIVGALSARTKASISISKADLKGHAVFDAAALGGIADDLKLLGRKAGPVRVPYSPGDTLLQVAQRFLKQQGLASLAPAPPILPSKWDPVWGWQRPNAGEGGAYPIERPGSGGPALDLYRGRANRLSIRFYVSIDLKPGA